MAHNLRNRGARAALVLATAAALLAVPSTAGAGPSSSTSPTKTLTGPSTQLVFPFGVAVDRSGLMYVANPQSNSITAYAADWASGDTPPVKTLSWNGAEIPLAEPAGIAFDASDRMYVTSGTGLIVVYAADWIATSSGLVVQPTPLKVLDIRGLGLGTPLGIEFDSAGRLHVTLQMPADDPTKAPVGGVAAFAADWVEASSGLIVQPQPLKVLKGASTGLSGASFGIDFDKAGRMYVTGDLDPPADDSDGNYRVLAYAANWASGDTAPFKILQGPASGISYPVDLAFSSNDTMYVTNLESRTVTAHPANWAGGDTPPSQVISGILGGQGVPVGVTFDSDDNMYLTANGNGPSPAVLVFAPDKVVEISGARPQATKMTLTGKTSGIRIGSTVTPYIKVVARGQKFKALPAVKVTGKNQTTGSFRVQVTGLNPKKAYQVYVVVDGVRSRTVTLAAP